MSNWWVSAALLATIVFAAVEHMLLVYIVLYEVVLVLIAAVIYAIINLAVESEVIVCVA